MATRFWTTVTTGGSNPETLRYSTQPTISGVTSSVGSRFQPASGSILAFEIMITTLKLEGCWISAETLPF